MINKNLLKPNIMRKLILLAILILIFSTNMYCQKWTYSSGGNAFDGKYKTSSIKGVGSDYPYNSPFFVVNCFEQSNINIYISDAGYAGCDSKIAKIKFNGNDTIFTFSSSTNSDNDVWFIHESSDNYSEDHTLSESQLLKRMMKYNKMFVRLSSKCGDSDLEFSLTGSTQAITYVLPENYFETQELLRLEKLRVIQEKTQRKLDERKKIQEEKEKINQLKSENKYLVETGTNLYPNPNGTGASIVHISSNTFVEILDILSEKSDYLYVNYNGEKGYMNKRALKDYK